MKIQDVSKRLNSSLEARMLLKHVTGFSDADLISNDSVVLRDEQTKQLEDCIEQRLNGRPISKIIGYKEFYGRDFVVTDDVLDPRPDSEALIEAVLNEISNKESDYRILDMGMGSGCLILTLLSELPNTQAIASDLSEKAIEIAKQNAKALGVEDRVEFIESDWFESIEGQFDIIVSNPPYIETNDISNLDKTVSHYDPVLALDGGNDGLNPYKVILPQIDRYLKKGGVVALEHGKGQCGRIKEIAEMHGLSPSRTINDLSGHDRVFLFSHK